MKGMLICYGFVTIFIVTFSALSQTSIQLPTAAVKALDQQFSHWKPLEYSKALFGDQIKSMDTQFFKCQLNHDTIPDYALGIVVNNGKNLTVHFVALVSNRYSFLAFSLAFYVNPNPLTVYLYLYPKNAEVSNFGWDDDEANVPKNLLRRWNKDELISKFDIDCLSLVGLDKNGCHTFVFERGKFWSFEACD